MKIKRPLPSLTDTQRLLAEQNHNLIYFCLKKFHFDDIEEYYDIAAIGLCKAAATYRKDRGTFTTYACMVIRNELYHACRKKQVMAVSLYTEYGNDTDSLALIDTLAGVGNMENDVVDSLLFLQAYQTLTEKEQSVVRLLIRGVKQQDAGKAAGCSQAQVSRILKKLRTMVSI